MSSCSRCGEPRDVLKSGLCKPCRALYMRAWKYGMTMDDVEAMLERIMGLAQYVRMLGVS